MSKAAVLRNLITFANEPDEDEQVACSIISVKGDATYCINGPVCGDTAEGSSKQVSGACPAEGDAAIGHCIQTSRSFAKGCVAPVDAQCVISALDHWECVFPVASNDSSASTALDEATQLATLSSDKLALSASTQDTSTTSESEKLVQGPNAALNIVVGVSCCILALVGIVYVKKRRNAKQARDSVLSHSTISIVTL
ncbi:hypothetical protein JG688_00011850 [Phytophthora aleatoria]|uniref:Uncharacterized protein n=1 Tax=Phytophthora aleatoria TaxID=2496075 RepID=A0A8J5IG64_9STRA|nr:hypothetical protein JG688_00011850 [Phytophthora aleatoria]